jgi:tetratricopeptide (TPR) repeat protein
LPYPCPSHSWRIASEGQNQLRRDAPAETRRSNSLLRGQATHEHFSIETSAVVTPVRTTVAPSEVLTRINALSVFSMRRARPSARHQIARSATYALSPGNLAAAREIAAICLARGNLDEAELFAREAHSHASSNPYIIDILISTLIKKHGRSAKNISEINDLFDILEKVGEEGGRSFFTTRKAEFEHLWGKNKEALRLIAQAVKKTETLFEPRRIMAEAYLKDGNKVKALETINVMREMVNARDPSERRSNYRLYLVTYAHYLTETGEYTEAKEIYEDQSVFTRGEREAAIRDIEIVQAFKTR